MSDDSRGSIETLSRALQLLGDCELSNLDVPQTADAFQALEKLSRDLDEAKSERHRFVSHVSHELRVPMTSILGYTDLLRKGLFGEVDEQQLKILEIIRDNVERMAILVSNLSDLSKIETGRLNMELVGVSLSDMIDEVVRNLQPRFVEKSQALYVDVSPELPLLFADHDRLVQVLTALLDNANRYTFEAGEIRLNARLQEQGVRISVTDKGIGINQMDQSHIFEQFFRSDDPYVREQPGWGLSLSVIRHLVEKMDGEMGMASELGKGSTFWLILPGMLVE